MWLLRGLLPGYRTIANFRRDNVVPLKQVSRDFVMRLRGLDLLGGEIARRRAFLLFVACRAGSIFVGVAYGSVFFSSDAAVETG